MAVAEPRDRAVLLHGQWYMKLSILQIVVIVFLGVTAGCAGAGGEAGLADQPRESGSTHCISPTGIRDYRVLDDSNLIVSGPGRRNYHMVLGTRVTGLQASWKIAFRSASGMICSGFGEVIVDDGFGPTDHRIVSVRSLAPEDEEELLIRFGKLEPKYESPPATSDVAGAEVEELD